MSSLYGNGEYLEKYPTWHVEHSPWKASQILRMIQKHNLSPKTICEVGCGAGEILKQLQTNMDEDCNFLGYEISPQAFELCEKRSNKKLQFKLKDFTRETDVFFDLLLFIDVIEHVEDYFGFLRNVRTKGSYKIFHVPLDVCSIGVLRRWQIGTWSGGHIHHFMKDTALQALRYTGYEIVDYFYTLEFKECESSASPFNKLLMNLLRNTTFQIHADLSVRLFGGCLLLILAK